MELTVEAVLIAVSAVGAAVLVAALGRRLPAGEPVFERSLRRHHDASETWPSQLVRLEHIVGWAGTNAGDTHGRLRPVLVEIADARLARRGLRLDRNAAEAEHLLGPDGWELVRPDRPPPADPTAPGIGTRRLASVLDAMEAV